MQLHVQCTSSMSTYPTVVDGATPTFPEWVRDLRVYLNINQFEHIELVDFAYDAAQPLLQPTSWSRGLKQQHQ